MAHTLPELPYALDALAPTISKETLEYHYGKHHTAYVTNLNKLIEGTEHAESSLEELIMNSSGGLFNNAAQVWNHTFYWNCLSPTGGGEPTGAVADAICSNFNSVQEFKDKFSQTAITTFGSGWGWLIQKDDGSLDLLSTSNAGSPMTDGHKALLTCDVWEHAYYVDYRNARPKYVEAFWNIVNWEWIGQQLAD